jgi:hypothetical protein
MTPGQSASGRESIRENMSREIRIAKLQAGETVQYRESGNSMKGLIGHRELITCEPISDYATVRPGEGLRSAVFCKVRGNYYTHLVKAVRERKGEDGSTHYEFLIGNNRGGTNGWTPQEKVFGRVVRVES